MCASEATDVSLLHPAQCSIDRRLAPFTRRLHPNASMSTPSAPLIGTSLQASVTVKDLARSTAWFVDAMGFTIDRRVERDGVLRAVALRAGDVRILLNQDDGAKGWERVKGAGLSLQISTVQDVDAIAKRIREHGNGGTVESEPQDMPWGARVFRVRDPDGFRWVISRPLAS
jgi:uncharacterized glyoxalase superfamily protein PhnB